MSTELITPLGHLRVRAFQYGSSHIYHVMSSYFLITNFWQLSYFLFLNFISCITKLPSPNLPIHTWASIDLNESESPSFNPKFREDDIFTRPTGVIRSERRRKSSTLTLYAMKVACHVRVMNFREALGEKYHCAYLIHARTLVFQMLHQQERVQLEWVPCIVYVQHTPLSLRHQFLCPLERGSDCLSRDFFFERSREVLKYMYEILSWCNFYSFPCSSKGQPCVNSWIQRIGLKTPYLRLPLLFRTLPNQYPLKIKN